jgi:hypothetical protein
VALENVKVVMTPEEGVDNFKHLLTISVNSLLADEMQSVYVVYKKPKDEYPVGK